MLILDDIRWAWGMLRLRRLRRQLLFSSRLELDSALQHPLEDTIDGVHPVIAYPDAFWNAQRADIARAILFAEAAVWSTLSSLKRWRQGG